MIEVLVSIFVLSVGLLGLAGMQASGLRSNQSAYFRSQATELAYSMADSMRANVAGVYDSSKPYHNKGKTGSTTAGHDNAENEEDVPTSCESASCEPSEVADYDIAKWGDALTAKLPLGTGWICIDATPDDGASAASPACDGTGNVYAIKVWWDDDRKGSSDKRFAMGFRP